MHGLQNLKHDYQLRRVCPCAWNNSSPHWTDFHEIWYSTIVRKIFSENFGL